MAAEKKREMKRKLIISGYTRENTKLLSSEYPSEINAVIELYLLFEWLQWNICGELANKYAYVDDELKYNQIRSISVDKNVVIVARDECAISSSQYDRFYFEVALIEFPPGGMDCMVGYVPFPLSQKLRANPNYFLGGTSGHSLYISEFKSYFEVYSNYKGVGTLNFQKKKKAKKQRLKEGDKIGIEFNFMANESLVYYNGTRIGLMGEDIPANVIPAVTLNNKQAQISCSQWKSIKYA